MILRAWLSQANTAMSGSQRKVMDVGLATGVTV
jgi:hypothetical protein